MTQSPMFVRHRAPLLAAALALLALPLLALALPAAATAKKGKITGELTKPGYTVIALASDGQAGTKRAPKGSFELKPPAKKVSLHLRASDGTYGGPVVLEEKWNVVKAAKRELKQAKKKLKKAEGKKAKRKAKKKVKKAKKGVKQAKKRASGTRAIGGLKAGAELEKVSVNSLAGYAKAKLKQRQWKKWVVEEVDAQAKDGVPIGAGNFGRVRVKKVKDRVPGDLDRDGVADPLDIDDDGDLVLDNLDREPREGSKARASQYPTGAFGLSPWLQAYRPEQAVNANAPGLSEAQIKAALPSRGTLGIQSLSHVDPTNLSSELDCGGEPDLNDPEGWIGGLIYCTRGGTGVSSGAGPGSGDPFPGEPGGFWDPDGDGFGSFIEDFGLYLSHRATSDQIKTGDVLIQLIEHADPSVDPEKYVATLPYVFETTPALVSYDDGQGNSQELSYPIPGNDFPVEADPTSGDVVVELEFWRPQRRPIPPETGDWYDMGGLDYAVANALPANEAYVCDPGTYSTDDPNLVPTEVTTRLYGDGGGFRDLAPDKPAAVGSTNTFTFQLNLTECAEEKMDGGSFDPGEIEGFVLVATSSPSLSEGDAFDLTNTVFRFQRAP